MAFAKKSAARTTLAPRPAPRTVVVRAPSRPITQHPRVVRLEARLKSLGKRTHAAASKHESTLLVLAGAAAPALVQRFTNRSLPTVAGIDPSLLWGGALMALSTQTKGKMRERLMSIGTGVAAPGLARSITSGSIKVSGDDDVGADEITEGDDDVGSDEII